MKQTGNTTEAPSCQQHKKEVAGITDMKVLAEMISDLHYEQLNEFLKMLEVKLYIDGSNDIKKGRKKLGKALQKASNKIEDAAEFIRQAWEISKPFMTDKTTNQ